MAQSTKNANRLARHARVRKMITGHADRPRLIGDRPGDRLANPPGCVC